MIEYVRQSADLVAGPGETVTFSAIWKRPNGATHTRVVSARADRPGRYVLELYPLSDDGTAELRDAQPARWTLDVTPA